MERKFLFLILLSVGVSAQTTQFTHQLYTEVSVPQSQLETTQIVRHPTSLSSNIRVDVTAEKNVTKCTELALNPCPEPELLVTVSAVSNENKKYNFSKTITDSIKLTIDIDSEVKFTTESINAVQGQVSVYLIYNSYGSFGSLKSGGNSSVFTVQLRTTTTARPNSGSSGSGTGSGSGNGQPSLYHGGLFALMALMLFPAFLLK